MRRCFNIDYPRREERNDQGAVVRVVALPAVKCTATATQRSSVKWDDDTTQHTYTCDDHADKLRAITTDAGFTWNPQPYAPRGQ